MFDSEEAQANGKENFCRWLVFLRRCEPGQVQRVTAPDQKVFIGISVSSGETPLTNTNLPLGIMKVNVAVVDEFLDSCGNVAMLNSPNGVGQTTS